MTEFLNPMYLLAVLLALTVHEYCHALAAYLLGDTTARDEGRLTLSPVSHLDLFGTILFFLVGFGWAKPVPVNPLYFRHPKRDTAIVALAGPVSNLLMGFVAFALLLLLGSRSVGMQGLLAAGGTSNALLALLLQFLRSSLFINVGLFAFNLLPIAPLDGSKVLHPFVPLRYEHLYDAWLQRGAFILLFLLVFEQALPFAPITGWVMTLGEWTVSIYGLLAGVFV